MNEIGNYTIINSLHELSTSSRLFVCESVAGENYEVLFIKKPKQNERSLERILQNEVRTLIEKSYTGIQQILESDYDTLNEGYYIVYENIEGFEPLQNAKDWVNNKSILELAKGLEQLKKENRQCHFISPMSIYINAKGNIKLKYLGLFDWFVTQGIIEPTPAQAPALKNWLTDKKKPRPNFQDDIYVLIQCFSYLFYQVYTLENPIIKSILDKGLHKIRTERFAKYSEFIELLEQLPSLPSKHLESREICKVKTQPEHAVEFETIVSAMNEETRILVDTELSKQKNQVMGQFSTQNHNGRFFVDAKGYLFIPFKGIRDGKNEYVLRDEKAFIAPFGISTSSSSTINVYQFFNEKYKSQNKLVELSKTKGELVNQWQVLPKNEKEHIEENAFKAKYTKRERTQNTESRIKFFLSGLNRNSWEKLKDLKNDGVILFINDQKIGKILDFNPKDKFLIIKDAFCTIDEIDPKGELIEDVRQETSQFKKQVQACQKFSKQDVVNPVLCSIIATPDTIEPNLVNIPSSEYDLFEKEVFNSDLKTDESQREAVLEALHTKPLYLIQGPPGTGKTTVIVELIRQLTKEKSDVKVLVTSQSNLAVDNVLEKLHEVNERKEQFINFIRLASENIEGNVNVTETIMPFTFENKLKNWVMETQKRSNQYLKENYSVESSNKALVDFYGFYNSLNKETDWQKFNDHLARSANYLKRLFEKEKSFKEVNRVFEKEIDMKYLKLLSLQKDWFAFLDGVLTDDGKDRKKSMLNNGSTEIDLLTAMITDVNVVGATCIHIASGKYSSINFNFDYVIMDESSKATPAEALVPINMGKNIVLIGDHKQLPPVITREDAVKKKVKAELEDNGLDFDKTFGESLFESLIKEFEQDDSNRAFYKMLDIQYRMPKQVGALISKHFYGDKLKNPELDTLPDFDKSKAHGLPFKKQTSVVFLSTSKTENPNDNGNKHKRQNKCNVSVIKELLEQLNTLYADNLQKPTPFTIGIIAGYRGQVELLKSSVKLSDYDNFFEKGDNKNLIEINTVDKFQGAERDIIIYDVVRSDMSSSNIGFLDDYRRINVAFSRVKRLLFVVGDSEYLLKRAKLNPNGKFPEFKLKNIVEELNEQDLIVHHLNDML